MSGDMNTLKQDLDTLADRGARRLRRWAFKEAVESETSKLPVFAFAVPIILVCVALLKALFGLTLWTGGFVSLVLWGCLAALVLPLLIAAVRVGLAVARARVDRRLSLAVYDRELGFEDRLQTADEFLDQGEDSGFKRAAIEDARESVTAALNVDAPETEIAGPRPELPDHRLAGFAAAALIGALILNLVPQLFHGADDGGLQIAELETKDGIVESESEERAGSRPMSSKKDRSEQAEPQQSEEAAERSRLKTQASDGQASNDESSSMSSNDSSGQSSSSSESSSAPSKPKPQKKSDPKAQKPRDPKEQEQKEQEPSASDSSSGLGSGSATSSGTPTDGSQETKQPEQSPNPGEEEAGDDDDADEEEDERQESKGAQQPNLNNRKAPADRSLSPGGGGEAESEDANGRGGPSGLKKTRGVAAMLLGVPMPDRLRGMNNPGRMKITRERGQPTERDAELVAAQERQARDGSYGHVTDHIMSPSLANAVRTYFEDLRAETAAVEGDNEKEM